MIDLEKIGRFAQECKKLGAPNTMLNIAGNELEFLIVEVERLHNVIRQQNDRCAERDSENASARATMKLPPEMRLIDGIKLVIESRDNARRECDEATRGFNSTLAELDELRTRHARLVDSTDTFVAALVDERFKKDHAAMLAELHTLRTKDTEASKRLRIEINAMPDKARAVFEHARIDAKVHGVSIMRWLIDTVVNVRATAAIECDRLRNECRKHLARINVLESEKAEALTRPRMIEVRTGETIDVTAGDKIKFVMTVGSMGTVQNATTLPANESTGQDAAKIVGKVEDVTSANVVPDDVLQRAADWANTETRADKNQSDIRYARRAMAGKRIGCQWYDCVREFVKLWREGQAPDMPQLLEAPSVAMAPMCTCPKTGKLADYDLNCQLHGITDARVCTCPPASEYDNPCPRHGVVGIGFTKHPDLP
jgi:hypothetical protein